MKTLPPQPWLTASSTRAVMAALEARGGEGCARFVGGAVRNAVMGLEVDDVDIATALTPEVVIEALKAAHLKFVPTGLIHGTITAIAEKTPFEITTLRRDVTTDGRNATVAFTDDWYEDAMRRDFRLNALYADADGVIFDPTGEGLNDARQGRIVFVGDAQTRIQEDYLRILRFFRFYAWYGRGDADATALAACEALKDGMVRLSAERVSKELFKLLAAFDPTAAVRLMDETGVLAQVLPEAKASTRFEAMVRIHEDPVLRLAALLDATPQGAGEAAARLRLSNVMRDRLVAALGDEPALHPHMSEADARRVVYAIGGQAFTDRMLLGFAQGPPSPIPLLQRLKGWARPTLPVSGKDALALGLQPGPRVTEVLRAVEAWWIANDFPEDRETVLAELRRQIG